MFEVTLTILSLLLGNLLYPGYPKYPTNLDYQCCIRSYLVRPQKVCIAASKNDILVRNTSILDRLILVPRKWRDSKLPYIACINDSMNYRMGKCLLVILLSKSFNGINITSTYESISEYSSVNVLYCSISLSPL